MTPAPLPRALVVGLTLLALVTTTGCPGASRGRRGPVGAPTARRSQSDQTALFNSIRDKLRLLPESSQMELSPPAVVLDARRSLDGEEIRAVLLTQPDDPEGPANRVVVRSRNVRFRNNVQPGDILKYYIQPDEETQNRFDETGEVEIATYEAIDLIVAQVVGENELLIVGGLGRQVMQPSKLEVWRISSDRMEEIDRSLGEYFQRRLPPLGWHPSPDEVAHERLAELLNQWLRQAGLAGDRVDPAGWTRPTLLATLPARVAEDEVIAPLLSDKSLGAGYFATHEVRPIQAATWSRDVSAWARGGATSPTDIAAELVDWTARNLQPIEADEAPARLPWEVVLHGRGTVPSIAEVLIGLCRQRGLTCAVLEVPLEGEDPYLLVGVLDGDQLRLFDPGLGEPLPGETEGEVATLAGALADDAVLRRLDLPDAAYPVTAETLAQTRVFAVASPLELSRRAEALAGKLGGDYRLVLYAEVDAEAELLGRAEGVSEVTLWPAPFEAVIAVHQVKKNGRRQAVREFLPYSWRPQLWRGRMQHLRGANLEADAEANATAESASDHVVARRLYMNRAVRPSDQRLARVTENKRDVYRLSKAMATLFLAQLSYDGESYKTARRWLEEPTLSEEIAAPFRPNVDYNLGRVFEKLGENEAAITAYEAVTGPRRHGALIRAERLRTAAAETVGGDGSADEAL